MWTTEYNDDNFCIRDGVYGVVTGGCSTGVFIELENGQSAFAKFGARTGQKVLCTVLRKAADTWRVLVTVDSLIGENPMAA